jgi:hypothetical protein
MSEGFDHLYSSAQVLPFDSVENSSCCQCQESDEVPLIDKLRTCDLFLQIVHRLLIWLSYLLLLILSILILFYSYQGIVAAKGWILSIWESLYEYVQSLFSLLQTVYDLVMKIPEQIADFFEDILIYLIEGANDILPW